MEAKDIFSESLPKEQIDNLASYFMTLPSEVGMNLWTVVGQGTTENVIALHGAAPEGKPISTHLVELMTGKTSDSEEDSE